MARETAMETLRDRLVALLADWDAEFSMEKQRNDQELERLKSEKAKDKERIAELLEHLDEQSQSSESLRAELETHKALLESQRADAESLKVSGPL